MTTDTSERGLERLICTALPIPSLQRQLIWHQPVTGRPAGCPYSKTRSPVANSSHTSRPNR